jgi:hypothetical protein
MKRIAYYLAGLCLMVFTLMITGCGDDNNDQSSTTTSTGSISAPAGVVAAGTTVTPPAGVTSMTFLLSSTLENSANAPVPGPITTIVTRSTNAGSLPAPAPSGTSLAVFLDIKMYSGPTATTATTVTQFIPNPMTVVMAVPGATSSVDIYSFNGTSWVLEHPSVAVIGGNATFTVTHLSIWACFSVNNPLTITTTSPLPAGTVGTAYSQTLAASGGTTTAAYTWTLAVGSTLPAGLVLSTAGVISGTPTTAGTVSANITVSDATARTATKALSITVNPAGTGLSITTATLSAGTVGIAYSQTLAATGGTTPYTWSVSVGTLPAGLTLNTATGAITGTPTTAATASFTVMVTDSATPTAGTATKALSITVSAAGAALTVTTVSPLPVEVLGTAYSQTLAATGGTAPYTWTVSVGTLPAGLSLAASTGIISGTPLVATTANFTVTVTDSATPTAGTATKALSITSSTPAGLTAFATNCGGCHGILTPGVGVSLSPIAFPSSITALNAAIAANTGGMGSLSALGAATLSTIAGVLH